MAFMPVQVFAGGGGGVDDDDPTAPGALPPPPPPRVDRAAVGVDGVDVLDGLAIAPALREAYALLAAAAEVIRRRTPF